MCSWKQPSHILFCQGRAHGLARLLPLVQGSDKFAGRAGQTVTKPTAAVSNPLMPFDTLVVECASHDGRPTGPFSTPLSPIAEKSYPISLIDVATCQDSSMFFGKLEKVERVDQIVILNTIFTLTSRERGLCPKLRRWSWSCVASIGLL